MKRPLGLTIIGTLFILAGASALFEVVRDLMHLRINMNFAVLMLPVGMGLLKGRPSSRSWAKFWIGLFFLIGAACLVAYTFDSDGYRVRFESAEVRGLLRHVPGFGLPIVFITGGVLCWRYLSSRKTDEFFDAKRD